MTSPFSSKRGISLDGVSVMIAMPVYRDLPGEVLVAMVETVAALDRAHVPWHFEAQLGCSLPHHARSQTAHRFLNSNLSHIFWIDSDILWTAEEFMKMLALGTKMSVVTGTYPAKRVPIQFHLQPETKGVDQVSTNEWGCMPVGGAGLGFTVVQREAMEHLARSAEMAVFPDTGPEPIPYIFKTDIVDGHARGEDMAFFSDLREQGDRVWLYPDLNLGHIGPRVYQGSLKAHLQKAEKSAAVAA